MKARALSTDIKCLACESSVLSVIATMSVDDVDYLYRRGYRTAVRKYFPADTLSLIHCHSCDLRFFDPPATGDGAFYESLSADPTYYMDDKPEFGFARRFISSGDAVLEIGGGRGGFAKSLTGARYVGLEFNKESVAAAAASGIPMTIESIEAHAARNKERYDAVCSFQVLEHIADPTSFARAALACLKPNGLLIVSVPSYDSFLRSAPNLVLNMPPHHVTLWTDRALINLSTALGTRLVALYHEKVASYHLRWYIQCLFYQALGPRRDAEAPIDLRRKTRALFSICGSLAGLSMPLLRGLRNSVNDEYLPNGHAVVLVARKA